MHERSWLTISDLLEIDEARFFGRGKFNQGRLLNGNERAESTENDFVLAV